MIKFFRRIRRSLIQSPSGKPTSPIGRYFLYAIGEIALVVIGILIALQINNWNEERKNINLEEKIAEALHGEMNDNISYVQRHLDQWEKRESSTIELSDMIHDLPESVTNEIFDSLLTEVLTFNPLDLKRDKFDRILSDESFEFKKSENLINILLGLKESYSVLEVCYDDTQETWKDKLHPYLIENYSFRVMFFQDNNNKQKRDVEYKKLLFDTKFDNIILSLRAEISVCNQWFQSCIQFMKSIMMRLEEVYPHIAKSTE